MIPKHHLCTVVRLLFVGKEPKKVFFKKYFFPQPFLIALEHGVIDNATVFILQFALFEYI